ncbi:MAG: DegT/DnrJ/EryC1/StrS aminotransferase family protein [Nitrospirota bacterium]|nr:DegT/DnrJ/EryC1/StrS aminotransferase family protein [Nitrospirota bacterium]
MREVFLPFSPPSIGQEEIEEVVATLRSDWITTGPRTKRFEDEFATFIGAPGALALNSGTSALHIAMAALGIGRGDIVITTPMTFCSSVHVIEHVGAQPVLVDVDRLTLTIDPAAVEAAVQRLKNQQSTSPVKAILPVHLYGHPCDMDALHNVADEHHLHVIEDAAHALPAKYHNRPIGMVSTSRGHGAANLIAFSFYATKNLTTAEGGMLVGSTDVLQRARIWSLHGMSSDAHNRYGPAGSWQYEVAVPGFKCNMTDIQAAIGIHQLRKLPAFHNLRRQIAERYNRAFADTDALETPVTRNDVSHAWHLYVLRLNLRTLKIDRARFVEELRGLNIGSSVHFIPIHLHSYYRDRYRFEPTDFPVAFQEYERIVSLPLNPRMTDEDVGDVVDAVTSIAHRFRR